MLLLPCQPTFYPFCQVSTIWQPRNMTGRRWLPCHFPLFPRTVFPNSMKNQQQNSEPWLLLPFCDINWGEVQLARCLWVWDSTWLNWHEPTSIWTWGNFDPPSYQQLLQLPFPHLPHWLTASTWPNTALDTQHFSGIHLQDSKAILFCEKFLPSSIFILTFELLQEHFRRI